MSEALEAGISRYRLYKMLDEGIIEKLATGLYRLTELPPISDPDLATVTMKYPKAVVCLTSALAFHNMTTQIPRTVSIAIPRDMRIPKLEYPPVQAHKFSNDAYHTGIESHAIDGIEVKIYDREKTLVDCFKYRNKLGMDLVLEALKLYRSSSKIELDKLLQYAKVCRVEKIMRPYLELSI